MPPLGTSSSTHVGFNDLPTELRLQIYKEALTGPSGALTFPSFSSQKKHGLATSLLATCSSISSCATPLLYTSNVFLLEVEASSNTDLGVFPTSLPMHVLPRIQHAFMVFDARHTVPYSSPRGRHHSNLDQMTGLKSLGISIITLREHVIDRIRWEGMLWTVVENVPKGCHLHFGATSDAEKAFVNRFIDSEGRPFSAAIEPFKDAYCMRPGRTNMNTFSALCFREANSGSVEVAEEVLNKTLKKIRALQSLKSG
ncbi:hypothetical protein MMC30_004022 [Trapelia coarctata]|nr:hypothetical protein [Trapelia coarctata]